jgi:hypothetical protein
MELKGKITKDNQSVYNAKVYITNATMDFVDKTRITRTNSDGIFKLPAPTIDENGVQVLDTSKYIAFESYSPQGKGVKKLEKGKLDYNFDTENFPKEQEIAEFTVTANKPTPQPEQKTTIDKPNKYWWLLPSIIGLLCAGGIVYIVVKNRKK